MIYKRKRKQKEQKMRVPKTKPMVGFKAVSIYTPIDDPRRMTVGTVYTTKTMSLADQEMFSFCTDVEDAMRACLYTAAFEVFKVKAWGTVLDIDGCKVAQHIQLDKKLSMRKLLTAHNNGKDNLGLHNNGSFNCGNCNCGQQNYGDYNFGNNNSGSYNEGDGNRGSHNFGNCNLGDYNEGGAWNAASHTENCFFTTKSHRAFLIFNKPYKDASITLHVPDFLNIKPAVWIPKDNLKPIHKRICPRIGDIDGCPVYYDYTTAFQISFERARRKSDWPKQRQMLLDLPNFDAGIFEEITGITPKDLGL